MRPDLSCNETKMSPLGRWHLDQTRTLEPVAVTPRAHRAAVVVTLVALVVGVLLAMWCWAMAVAS